MLPEDIKNNYKILKSIAADYNLPLKLVVKLYQSDIIGLPIMDEDNSILQALENIIHNNDILDELIWKRLSKIKKSMRQDYINTIRFNKLERYVYTRLINAYKNNKTVFTATLIAELSRYYKIPVKDNVSNYNRLKLIVKKMRRTALRDYRSSKDKSSPTLHKDKA